MYQLKLLELIGIELHQNNYYLHVRLQLEEDSSFYWQLDEETAKALQAITDFTGGYHYRLSFKSKQDIEKKQYIGFIHQTYREQSKRFEFSCSEEFIVDLNQIKLVESCKELDKLSFLSHNLLDEVQPEDAARPQEKTKRRLAWPLTTALITLIAVIVTYTGHSILTKAVAIPSNTATVDFSLENPISVEEKNEPRPETILLEENITIEETQLIPSFELVDTLAYDVPEGMVALTFDDGPSQFSVDIMDVLKEYEAGGTFFFIGTNVEKFPEHVAYIHENGYSIGTHSMTHAHLTSSSVTTQENELLQSSEAIKSITGEEVVLFRPPFGQFNDSTEQIVQDANQKIVMWNNDPKDWESRDKDRIIEQIKTTDVSGAIIILHETQATIDALPAIIEYLQGQGLQLVNLR
jgi:peptidoglycan-N-acetylglucosamine deacetylase